MAFHVEPLAIPDIKVITPAFFPDERGGFSEVYKRSDFEAAGLPAQWQQVNWSTSKHGVLRGMHYQLSPHGQGKLVSVIVGQIYDAVIDIRQGSPTYGQWVGTTLDAAKREMIWVPAGFAHGFCVVSEVAEVMYSCTTEYSRESERGIIWNDPAIGIAWPTDSPIVSAKDAVYPPLAQTETNFSYSKN